MNSKNKLRVVAVSPIVYIGNTAKNKEAIVYEYYNHMTDADIIVTPELSITGYTCADLFGNQQLLENAKVALTELTEMTNVGPMLIVGVPLVVDGILWNCAAVMHSGSLIAVIPKTYLPNYGEFYEKRWFQHGFVETKRININHELKNIPFGNNILISMSEPNAVIGVEVCEDAWAPVSPGRLMALAGAEIIINISASNEIIGKADYRRNMLSDTSASCLCGYVYVSAGMYESTSDVVFGGHKLAFENGKCIAEVKPFEDGHLICDIQLSKIKHDRMVNHTFADCRKNFVNRKYETVFCDTFACVKERLLQNVAITPFIPKTNVKERCMSIFQMQVAGLQRRIETTKGKVVIGVSGGLDSTLALLVAAQAMKNLHKPASDIIAITMPGFGTTDRTKNNSLTLANELGCDTRIISIEEAVRQHFSDIGQDENVKNITYENCQARERTQILMDVANKDGGFVVGTGDLSELALGWCTYNGDHMSMYAVNTSIPKTLVRTMVDEVGHVMATKQHTSKMHDVIDDILDTPVSPELLPPNADGTIAQKTEDSIGSYILHDFFMYYTLRFGMAPEEIFELCQEAVRQSDECKFSDEEIMKWMNVFYKRFFTSQFKRNCMPDGVKVGTVSVSPRGDLRLPSEVDFASWMK